MTSTATAPKSLRTRHAQVRKALASLGVPAEVVSLTVFDTIMVLPVADGAALPQIAAGLEAEIAWAVADVEDGGRIFVHV